MNPKKIFFPILFALIHATGLADPIVEKVPCDDYCSMTCAAGFRNLDVDGVLLDVKFRRDSYFNTFAEAEPYFSLDPVRAREAILAMDGLLEENGILGIIGHGYLNGGNEDSFAAVPVFPPGAADPNNVIADLLIHCSGGTWNCKFADLEVSPDVFLKNGAFFQQYWSWAVFSPARGEVDYILNTGTPDLPCRGSSNYFGQFYAGEFTLGGAYSINSVESYFANSTSAGPVVVSLHEDGGYLPGEIIYSTTIEIPFLAPLDWYGPSGLDWVVSPGTYWLSFVPLPTLWFYEGYIPDGAPSPLDLYAIGKHVDGVPTWRDLGPEGPIRSIGYRINASKLIAIDIKPGSDPNSIKPSSRQKITVAILTTVSFDALEIFHAFEADPLSVKFGPGEATESHGRAHVKDVDGDGDMDLLLHFNTQDTGIQCGDTEATLTGMTFGGEPITITGTDTIVTVNCP